MASLDHDSGTMSDSFVLATDFMLPRDAGAGSGIDKIEKIDASPAGMSLDGDVVSCACPQCSRPMSVRLWLMIADCWSCGCSIELNEEQEQEALRLMEDARRRQEAQEFNQVMTVVAPPPAPAPLPKRRPPRDAAPAVTAPAIESPPQAAAIGPPPAAVASPAVIAPPAPLAPEAPAKPLKRRGRSIASMNSFGVRRRIEEERAQGAVTVWARNQFRDMPAWLTSLVFHMIFLIALGMLMSAQKDDSHEFTLSVRISDVAAVGDLNQKQEVVETTPFETTSPFTVEKLAPQELNTHDKSPFDQQAATSLLNVPPEPLQLSSLSSAEMVAGAVGMYDGRGEASRGQLVKAFGGTTASEAAVARGLRWLLKNQNADGSWSLNKFGGVDSDTSGTALGLLPFLGAGQSHLEGQYKKPVQKALDWLLAHQKPDGDLRSGGGRMYAHGQCAIALSEAYALSHDEKLRPAAQKAIDFIVAGQHPEGGWRYGPREAGDTSVVGWQLMALRSGQMAYLKIPPDVFTKSVGFLERVKTNPVGSRYTYMPGGQTSHVMTAEALLCRQYTGWPQSHPGLVEGAVWLLKDHRPKKDRSDMYYWYYATQVMHHQGGSLWEEWNEAMRELLIDTQESKGDLDGSWTPRNGPHDGTGGRIYMTSLSILTLEVYYRHLPLYDRSAVPNASASTKGESKSGSKARPGSKEVFDPLASDAPPDKVAAVKVRPEKSEPEPKNAKPDPKQPDPKRPKKNSKVVIDPLAEEK